MAIGHREEPKRWEELWSQGFEPPLCHPPWSRAADIRGGTNLGPFTSMLMYGLFYGGF